MVIDFQWRFVALSFLVLLENYRGYPCTETSKKDFVFSLERRYHHLHLSQTMLSSYRILPSGKEQWQEPGSTEGWLLTGGEIKSELHTPGPTSQGRGFALGRDLWIFGGGTSTGQLSLPAGVWSFHVATTTWGTCTCRPRSSSGKQSVFVVFGLTTSPAHSTSSPCTTPENILLDVGCC